MENKKLFTLPIKSISNYVKESFIQLTNFEIKKHNIIKFGNKNFMLKVARISQDGEPLTIAKFKKLKKYNYHLNQLYINEFDNLLLCLIFIDDCIYLQIPKKEIEQLSLTIQHNKADCFQSIIDLKKYINNEIKFS